jgi:hypothetical protein
MPMMPEGRMPKPGEVLPTFTWEPTPEHHHQARRNHGQTLTRLKERSGISWSELAAILERRTWRAMRRDEAKALCLSLHPQDPSHD